MPTKRQAIEQLRAATAWKQIETVPNNEDAQKKYGTLARKLASMIQINGLGSTLAFLRSKGGTNRNDEHNLVYKHLSNWVTTVVEAKVFDETLVTEVLTGNPPDLLDAVRNKDMQYYRRLTTEAIEYAIWLKRYVDALEWGKEKKKTSSDSDDEGSTS